MKTRGLNDGLVMKNLETYINLVRVTNAIGYEYTMRSNGVTVQETPILPGKVFDGDIDGYDLNYQPTKTTVSANWNGFGLPADAISQIEIESGIYISKYTYKLYLRSNRTKKFAKINILSFSF